MNLSSAGKILFIAGQFPPQVGGLARAAARNLSYLSDFQVSLLNLTNGLPAGRLALEQQGSTSIYRFGIAKSLSETLRLTATLIEDLQARNNFDLFIGFYLIYAGYLAAYYGRLFDRPSLVCARGNDIDVALFHPEQFPFLDWTLKNATMIGAVTRALASQAAALSGRNDIKYLPNSVDTEIWQPGDRDQGLAAQLGIKDELVVGFVGELRVKKSPAAMLAAFTQLRASRPAKLLLIGGARSGETKLINELKISDPTLAQDIILVDYISDTEQLKRYYSLIDIMLFVSLWEGMSNAMLESMAMARVIIASRVGGCEELISSGKTGFIIERDRLTELGDWLIEIGQMPRVALDEIRLAARSRVVEQFTIAAERQALLTALTALLNN